MFLWFVFIMLYPVFVAGITIVLNQKCLLPGTANYREKRMIAQARSHLMLERIRSKENEHLDRRLALEAPKNG